MRFLLINQFFAPDPAPTGQLLADVARALAAEGHSVKVVCGRAVYESCDTASAEGLEGVEVVRAGIQSFGRNPLSRLSSYASFFLNAVHHTMLGSRPDVILTLTTPPLLSLAGTLAKLLRGPRHIIWEMDVYPDVAVALNVFRSGGVLDRSIGMLADFSRRHADNVIALGPCMRQRLIDRGLPPANISVAENWTAGSTVSPRHFPSFDPLTLLYSGNLGQAHDCDTIERTMSRLVSDRFRFVFAGGGGGRAALESSCSARNATNVAFLPYQPSGSLSDHLGRCHVGLVTQKPETLGTVVPSKTYALMAAGRPFIFIGPSHATPALLINRFHCGWHIEPGDVAGLDDLLTLLAERPGLIRLSGERARRAFEDHCGLEAGVANILNILTERRLAAAASAT